MTERARLFVAAWPPPAVLDAIEALPRPAEPGVRYTTRDQWHVTLRFLGACEVPDALEAFAMIDGGTALAELGPAVARLGRSVVVVPVRGLETLAASVVAATGEVGEPPDPRPFTGHVTIARLKDRPACRIAGHRVQAGFAVSELHLVRSDLHPHGARYTTIATLPLRAG
jgi:RNA 2',3'-cyclic 3'-phosphodiesterase